MAGFPCFKPAMSIKSVLVGVVVGMCLTAPASWALRTERPPEFHEWNTNTFTQLNTHLLNFWNILNGRYAVDVVTVDPDGSRRGDVGEAVLFDTGTDQWCVNVGGTSWKCVNLT